MAYTVIASADQGPVATVAPSVVEALLLARDVTRSSGSDITIAAENGWILTLEELEELAKS